MSRWLGPLPDLWSDLIYYAPEWLRVIRNVLNWRLVRSIGQLQILTRASYVLLIVVPLLAATWPGVRLIVNQHNKAVREAADLLRSSRGDFERLFEEADAPANVAAAPSAPEVASKVRAAADRIGAAADRYTKDYAEHTISTPRLPWTLAAAFFAALFVALGHFVYQMAAPEPIRGATWDEFVLNRKEDYAKHPSDAAIDRAQEFLLTVAGGRVAESERFENENISKHLLGTKISEWESDLKRLPVPRLRSFIGWIKSGKADVPKDFVDDVVSVAQNLLPATAAATHADMSLIERGARAEYLDLATRRSPAVLVTGLLYAMGLWIVLLVVKVQATAVITAAEWTSVRDLFVH